MNRRVAAALAVVVLAGLAGCVGGPGGAGGGGSVPKNTTYQWHKNSTGDNVTITVTQDYYHAVYDVNNKSTLTFTQPSDLGGNTAVTVGATAFRYPNGTVVRNVSVDQQNSKTVVHLPAKHGQLAFTSPSTTRSVTVPIAEDGHYDVALPPGMRANIPVLGSVTPGGYTSTTTPDNRVHYHWSHVDGETIQIQYYLQRDAYIFAGFLVFLAGLTVVGLIYLRHQVQKLEEARREAGLEP